MSGTIYIFEEQINRQPLVASGNVQYVDEIAGDPLAALEARRFFMIAAPGISGASDQQGRELNDWMVNDINVSGLGIIDIQVHESSGRSRLVIAVEDPDIQGPPATVPLQWVRVRNWEEVVVQAGGTTSMLSVEQSQLPVADRDSLDDYLAELTERSVQFPMIAAGDAAYCAIPADPGAGHDPLRAFLMHRIHAVNGLTRIVTAEITRGHGGQSDPVTPLP